MNSEEYRQYILNARERLQRQEATTLTELRGILARLSNSCSEMVKRYEKDELKKAYYSEILASINQMTDTLNRQMLDSLYKGIKNSIYIYNTPTQAILKDLLGKAVSTEDIAQFTSYISDTALVTQLAKTRFGLKLSDRVWNLSAEAREQLDKALQDGIALGRDPREVAKDIQHLLNPNVGRPLREETQKRLGVKKDVTYEALRLAVTEMENASHEANIQSYSQTPGYKGVIWKLSPAHVIEDICDEYARHREGDSPEGFWSKGSEPVKPHPFCRCYVVPVYDIDKTKEAVKNWLKKPASEPDIENWFKDQTRLARSRQFYMSGEQRNIPKAQTVSEAEEIARKYNLAKVVDYREYTSVDIVNEMNEAIYRFYQKFPQLQGSIDTISDFRGFDIQYKYYRFLEDKLTQANRTTKTLSSLPPSALVPAQREELDKARQMASYYEGRIEEYKSKGSGQIIEDYRGRKLEDEFYKMLESGELERKYPVDDKAYGMTFSHPQLLGNFTCLINNIVFEDLDDVTIKQSYGAELGFFPEHSRVTRSVVYHELGHILDHTIDDKLTPIQSNHYFNEIKDLYEKSKTVGRNSRNFLSTYSDKSYSEFIADAVSEYLSAEEVGEKPNNMAQLVYNVVMKYYNIAIKGGE